MAIRTYRQHKRTYFDSATMADGVTEKERDLKHGAGDADADSLVV